MRTHDVAPTGVKPFRRWDLVARARSTLDAMEHLVGGLGTAVLAVAALFGLLVTAAACLVGVGVLLVPTALRGLRVVADRERERLSRWGPEITAPEPVPHRPLAALRDLAVRRELVWVAGHAFFGLSLGLAALTLPLNAVRDISFPLWWHLVPPDDLATSSMGLWTVDDLADVLGVALLGPVWLTLAMILVPHMARWQAWPGRRLLSSDRDADLVLRIAQLTATRAGALDAHAAELRRIERSLHDGTQNRLVAVTVLLGAARRALARDPEQAAVIVDRAQDAAEQALAELRAVVRSILPPVLTDRSLADALATLATACPVPCRIDTDEAERCAASVEATAYFAAAEALTNVARHSGAQHSAVTLRRHDDHLRLEITDDGHGGADVHAGSGLAGIRRRVEAHDGTFALTSPSGGPTTLVVSLPCGS
ncbi:sensor histidine kinase [Umezawaea beigongshangensis]|uniref:sensor histidine kinase n=1 Tax=Umezawaea beigongshangensis TaxID=2780383 RepID=UPI0018F195EC|nr:sensor histidine kinase [Umezawaea beigongshangensis]